MIVFLFILLVLFLNRLKKNEIIIKEVDDMFFGYLNICWMVLILIKYVFYLKELIV